MFIFTTFWNQKFRFTIDKIQFVYFAYWNTSKYRMVPTHAGATGTAYAVCASVNLQVTISRCTLEFESRNVWADPARFRHKDVDRTSLLQVD